MSDLLGDAPRTVEYWVQRFEGHGFAGLTESERSGRPSRLTEEQLQTVGAALRQSPAEVGLEAVGPWDGKALSSFLKQRFDVDLKARQCQRLFRRLGFRLRKPSPLIVHADPQQQAAYKNSKDGQATQALISGRWTKCISNIGLAKARS